MLFARLDIPRLHHLVVFVLVGMLLLSGKAFGQDFRLGVVYPEYPAPYNTIFESIIDGIRSKNTVVKRFPVAVKQPQHIRPEIALDGIIALGQQGLEAVGHIDGIPIVVGALPKIPESYSGVELTPEPKGFFKTLSRTLPEVKKVHVVYSRQSIGKLVDLAKNDIKGTGLVLASYEVNDLKEAVVVYRKICDSMNRTTDILWLPLDRITVDDNIVLPMLLELAWLRRLKIVSNKPAHARSGVLLSIYPDNYGTGQQLVDILLQDVGLSSGPVVAQSKQVSRAINSRSAVHLGLGFTSRELDAFDLVFPTR